MFSLTIVVTALGWVGAVAGVLAYAMVSRGRWRPDSLAFQLTNLAAAGAMMLVAAMNGVWPSAVANLAWVLIGGAAVAAMVRSRRRAHSLAPAPALAVVPALAAVPAEAVPAQAAVTAEAA
ncbi:CBU_0592 family membrane protein [Antribacter gilvus]|uniref:CBU_0592 family membrane protein n=1 Tax=Antribacter gilvus TaxID=2304675 RepID=UPI00197DBA48|nr:hypothetical protein [Antribacter gilvus]